MSSVPELKQKKIARDAEITKANAAAAAKAAADAVETNKNIFAKAEAYEKEYEAVSPLYSLHCFGGDFHKIISCNLF